MIKISTEGISQYQNQHLILNAQVYFIKKLMDITRSQQNMLKEMSAENTETGTVINKAV